MAKSKAERFAHAYHSEERVEWMASQPCVVCGRTPCHNAHVVVGGIGLRAHYSKTAPLCSTHHDEYDGRLVPGGKKTFAAKYGLNLEVLAAMYEDAWRKYYAHTDNFLKEEK